MTLHCLGPILIIVCLGMCVFLVQAVTDFGEE
jgi:type III secretory pathway component EscS